MEGLRELYIVISDPSPRGMWETNWLQLEEKLLEPVKEVKKPRWFELTLPYATCRTSWDMGESKALLRKPYGDTEDEEEDAE
jgi:hypothetical protein